MPRPSARRGLTLLELMIALAITTMLSGLLGQALLLSFRFHVHAGALVDPAHAQATLDRLLRDAVAAGVPIESLGLDASSRLVEDDSSVRDWSSSRGLLLRTDEGHVFLRVGRGGLQREQLTASGALLRAVLLPRVDAADFTVARDDAGRPRAVHAEVTLQGGHVLRSVAAVRATPPARPVVSPPALAPEWSPSPTTPEEEQ